MPFPLAFTACWRSVNGVNNFSPFSIRGLSCFVKRDELRHAQLNGNKYWKLYTLIHTPAEAYTTITSYGGIQSNAMLALAALCAQKGWQFQYTCKTIPNHLKCNPYGNYQLALHLGMQTHEVAPACYESAVAQLQQDTIANHLCIAQGGADPLAEQGINTLSEEIQQWQQTTGIQNLTLATPSGTGTTAFYIAKALPHIRVLTTAVVGDNTYLKAQMQKLGNIPDNLIFLQPELRYQFAKPYPEFLSIHQALAEAGITFDLIYASPMWLTLLNQQHHIQGTLLYLHSGGLSGNASMLTRYQRLE